MNCYELIKLLKQAAPLKGIYIWVDGERYAITSIDEMDDCIDIMADTEEPTPALSRVSL